MGKRQNAPGVDGGRHVCSTTQPIFVFFVTLSTVSMILRFRLSPRLLVILFLSKKSDVFLLPPPHTLVFVMKAGICSAWQCGLASGFVRLHPSASRYSLLACQPVWQCYTTTPVLRLQKTLFADSESEPACPAFPLVGRTHCHTATLSLLAKFLSCFALLSFFLSFCHFPVTLPLS